MKKEIIAVLTLVCCLSATCKKDHGTNITPAEVSNHADLYPSPPAKWFGGTHPYYSPAGFVGDVMPYFDKDSFHVFYLHDARDGASGFHPWNKFTTSNFREYAYDGVMIPYGTTSDYDLALGTGSIVKAGDTYYAFYSGFNPNFNGSGGKYRDNILMATSKDLDNWEKVPGFIIKPETTNGYNFWEYRDPYVFFNSEKNEYWMLVCGRKNDQAAVMLYTSADPATGLWQLQDPVYTTGTYNVPETPQMFKWGNFWYLFFSENSVSNTTRYRIAASSAGPWTTPSNDQLDGTYMYASKAATDGKNTYLFGWCATKSGSSDAGTRDFGGNLVVHQLIQNSDGTLNVKMPEGADQPFTKDIPLNVALRQEQVQVDGNNVSFPSQDKESLLVFDRIAGEHIITATISDITAGAEFGFVLGMDKALQNTNYYKIRFSESDDQVAGVTITNNTSSIDGILPIAIEPGKEYQLKMVIDGSVCVVYINDQVALTSRIYSANNNLWGLFAGKGGARFKNIELKGL